MICLSGKDLTFSVTAPNRTPIHASVSPAPSVAAVPDKTGTGKLPVGDTGDTAGIARDPDRLTEVLVPAWIKLRSFRGEQFLVPRLSPGDIVIKDNLGSHKGTAARKAIRAAGGKLLFLPPSSPDLNRLVVSKGQPSTLRRA